MTLILDAIQFASRKHKGQTRKVSGVPYVTHPIAVSYIVASYKRSKHLDEILAASILHDTLEDTDATFDELAKRFTPLVASMVHELSNDEAEIKRVGKLQYQMKKLCGISNYSLVVKLGDRIHNISDAPSVKMLKDTVELMQAVRKGRKLTKTQNEMVTAIENICREKLSETNEG